MESHLKCFGHVERKASNESIRKSELIQSIKTQSNAFNSNIINNNYQIENRRGMAERED